jgi:hypothetical protein
MNKVLIVLVYLCGVTSATAATVEHTYVKHADFVVTDVGGTQVQMTERTVDDVQEDGAAAVADYVISGDIGTFWSVQGKLAYIRERRDGFELLYDGVVVAESPHRIEQLGDITSTLAYCEIVEDEAVTHSVAHIGTHAYTFTENICNASTLSGSELISYGSAVYVNGKRTTYSVKNGTILNAFRYKSSLVYIPSLNNPFETRLMVGPTKLVSAPGLEGSIIEAAVQGGKLAYSIYKPEAGWSVIWGGEVVSRYHAYITGFLKNAHKLTYVAMTPHGALLFRENKVYGVGYDVISYMHETPRGNIIYVTTKTTKENDRTQRSKLQDVLWFNGTKLFQSLYAQNVFAKVVVIADTYPLVIVEGMHGEPQYVWYQGRIGLRGQKVIAAAQAGEKVALLVEYDDSSREIVYIATEQE